MSLGHLQVGPTRLDTHGSLEPPAAAYHHPQLLQLIASQLPTAFRRHQQGVARKLNAITRALLGMQQDDAAVERSTVPGRLVKLLRLIFQQLPAPLIFVETLSEIALH